MKRLTLFILLCFCFSVQVLYAAQNTLYPDYGYEYLGKDKWENFNRKVFSFNQKLNKFAIRPVHILWASIMPQYGMDRIKGVTNNIEFPIRFASSLIQKDFKSAKNETVRFITNTTLGLGGMFDPAKHLFKIEQVQENMEQALAGCKIKQGPYIVLPVISGTTVRGIFGSILDTALNPGSYIASPILAVVKAGLTVNKTSYMQPFIKMIEDTYADPYDIAKKAYGLERYIRCKNFDRIPLDKLLPKVDIPAKNDILVEQKKSGAVVIKKNPDNIVKTSVSSEVLVPELLKGGANIDALSSENFTLFADIILPNYNPQNPVVDSMRTAMFEVDGINKSIWNNLSIWNHSFANMIKTSSVDITSGKDAYKFKYIMQKGKQSPVAIIYPSIGEGINSSHSVSWAKLFYDAGFSVVIQGSHFHWEFVKSMPENYHPGLPDKDSEQLRLITSKILTKLENKYNYKFNSKVMLGTSFGAVEVLFVGDKEYKNPILGNVKYIAICPPVELLYAMKQIDKNTSEWNRSSDNFKEKVAQTAAKVVRIYDAKDDNPNLAIDTLPFSEEEGKLLTGFVLHQKLSDLIFTIENVSKTKSSDAYEKINNMDYKTYVQKYLLGSSGSNPDDISYEASLNYISDFLENSNDYKIYHSVNDYLTNVAQLKRLKDYGGKKVVLFDNGAHLGFTYRSEFINDLKNTISSLF